MQPTNSTLPTIPTRPGTDEPSSPRRRWIALLATAVVAVALVMALAVMHGTSDDDTPDHAPGTPPSATTTTTTTPSTGTEP
jgi:hypothetical protein